MKREVVPYAALIVSFPGLVAVILFPSLWYVLLGISVVVLTIGILQLTNYHDLATRMAKRATADRDLSGERYEPVFSGVTGFRIVGIFLSLWGFILAAIAFVLGGVWLVQ
jgi:hypothetical protein